MTGNFTLTFRRTGWFKVSEIQTNDLIYKEIQYEN